MKKVLLFLFVCLLAFLFVGCSETPEDPNKGNEGGDKPEEKKYSLTINDADKTVSLEVGDTKNIVVTFEGGTLEWLSSDSSVVSIEGSTLKALKAGSATITVQLKENTEYKATIAVTVTEKAPVVVTYMVYFYDSLTGDFIGDPQEVEEGGSAIAPVVTAEGFIGWDVEFDNVTSDLVVTSVYGKKCRITYMLSGGSWEKEEDKIANYYEGSVVALNKPVKDNYIFVGWSFVKGGTDTIMELPETQKGDVTLYAIWKEKIVEVEFDFNGGTSTEYFMAKTDEAATVMYVDNYNSNGGTFWSGAYADYVFIGNQSNDPGATFSDRIYIAKDSETGFYKVVGLIANGGGSNWPSGAEYVITVSSSYKAGLGFSTLHSRIANLGENIGQYVIFDQDFTTASASNKVNVYIFNELPTSPVVKEMKKGDKFFTGLKILGGTFTGWADEEGNVITSVEEINTDKIKLIAQYELDNPVTEIAISSICEEMLTGSTFNIVANVVPANAYFKQIIYSSSDTDVIVVDANGKLTAKNVGTATITMTDYVKKIKVEKQITVYPIDSIDIAFEDANGNDFDGVLKVGETIKIKAEAYGKGVNNPTYSFVSSDTNVLTVDGNGVVTAKATGTASIKVTDNTGSNFEVNVTIVVNELTGEDKVDKVLALLAENNFALVESGNISLMDNGSKREYVSTYGSVNRFLFDEFKIDRTYESTAENTYQSHGGASANYNCKLRTDWHGGVEFVTVHDTATTTGTVQSIGSYMSTGETSIHYTVGNDQILAVVPEKYIAYHAGDGTGTQFKWYDTGVAATDGTAPEFDMVLEGSTYYFVVNGQKTSIVCPVGNGSRTIQNPSKDNFAHLGPVWKIEDGKYYMGTTWVDFSQRVAGTIGSHGGNNNSIGIEMCVNYSGDIYDTWQRTAQLVADICLRYNLDLTRVKQHNTWTGKNCPQCLIAADYWWGFMKMVEVNYIIMKDYSDVEISMQSNNPTLVDNTGRVIGRPATTTTVSYDVTVKCGETTKTMTLYSVIPGTTTWRQWDGVYASTNGWKWGITR